MSAIDLASKVTERYQKMKQNMQSVGNFMGKWTNADGSLKQGVLLRQLEDKIAQGL